MLDLLSYFQAIAASCTVSQVARTNCGIHKLLRISVRMNVSCKLSQKSLNSAKYFNFMQNAENYLSHCVWMYRLNSHVFFSGQLPGFCVLRRCTRKRNEQGTCTTLVTTLQGKYFGKLIFLHNWHFNSFHFKLIFYFFQKAIVRLMSGGCKVYSNEPIRDYKYQGKTLCFFFCVCSTYMYLCGICNVFFLL